MMANQEHLKILEQGVKVWNEWRSKHLLITPNLVGVDLNGVDFTEANLVGARLEGAKLFRANLYMTDLSGSKLDHANLSSATLSHANLLGASFKEANLTRAYLNRVDLTGADLSGADFSNAEISYVIFAENDLSTIKNLEAIIHNAPSTVGIDTLYKSAGNIPESFLRGCGVPDDFIAFIPSHFGIQQAIQFYSCFISYSTKDEGFARKLYSRMRDEKLRVWFAPEDIQGGRKLQEQIEKAIQLHDRLLIVLSENSMQSEWVMTEIRRARKTEIEENRRKLFPIAIVDFDKIKLWKCFDADSGKDLAMEVREYFIPDFSNWKDHDAFEKAFDRLLRDLKAEEKKAG